MHPLAVVWNSTDLGCWSPLSHNFELDLKTRKLEHLLELHPVFLCRKEKRTSKLFVSVFLR